MKDIEQQLIELRTRGIAKVEAMKALQDTLADIRLLRIKMLPEPPLQEKLDEYRKKAGI